jgi:hypothetical protein
MLEIAEYPDVAGGKNDGDWMSLPNGRAKIVKTTSTRHKSEIVVC